jgi:thymidylate synthase
MNHLDKQYQELLFDIIENGVDKDTRNGKTRSVFSKQIRHKMSDGFPLLTTKKLYWKGIVTELLWFLRGDTNIKYLTDNDCHIWDGDAYKRFQKTCQFEKDANHILPDEWISMSNDFMSADILTQEEFINKIKTDDEFAKKWGDLGPVYGKQWRKWKTFRKTNTSLPHGSTDSVEYVDQIANLIRDLKTNPDSRRLMVTAWNPGELYQMVLPPCHYGFQVYTRELSTDERNEWFQIHRNGNNPLMKSDWKDFELDQQDIPKRAISLMWNQRSVDVPLGLPFNIASYGLLLEILAKLTNMVPDELIGNLGDCHIYENQLAGCREQITREPFALPKLSINDTYWVTSDEAREYTLDTEILSMLIEDFKIEGYESHPAIKFPLSN